MPKSSEESSRYDADSPRFTRDMMKRAVPFSALSPALQQALAPDVAQPNQSPEEVVSLHLSRDVADALRATGSGWQGRVNQHLREWLQSSPAGLEKAG